MMAGKGLFCLLAMFRPKPALRSTNYLSSTCFITHPNDNRLPAQLGPQLRMRSSEESTALQSQKGMSMLVPVAQLEPEGADTHTSEAAEIPLDAWTPPFPHLVVKGLGVLGL